MKPERLSSKVVLIGPFPPPVHGMSTTNKAIYESLISRGANVEIVDTASSSLTRSLQTHIFKAIRVSAALKRILFMHRGDKAAAYLSASGGFGKLYDIFFTLILRLRRMRIFIRHCSFAYLNRKSVLTSILLRLAGQNTTHIVQCNMMAEKLQYLYGVERIIPISNSVLYKADRRNPREELKVLGYLSNISVEKGVDEFLNLMEVIALNGLGLIGKLAGPFANKETEVRIKKRVSQMGNVEYVGPKYNCEKDDFFSSLDVFVFPTRYKDETEAKVNLEAMRSGLPVIAYGRGCIPEIITSECGFVIQPESPFAELAFKKIASWTNDPDLFQLASRNALERFSEIRSQSQENWDLSIKKILEQ